MENEEKRYEQLSRISRFSIYIIFIVLLIVTSGENGILSSNKNQVRKDLQLDEKEYGFFCSFGSAGRLIGGLVIMNILKKDRRKLISCICIFINGGAFFAYSLTYNKYILYFIRFLIGSVRIFPHIYIPVWIDQFGIRKMKTMMKILFNITSALGQTIGYVLGSINDQDKWCFIYKIYGCLILGLGSLLSLFPSKFFSAKYYFVGYQEEGIEGFVRNTKHSRKESFFEIAEMKLSDRPKGSMIAILKNPVYFLSAFVKANILFCFQAIHFNITSYVFDDLRIPEEEKSTIFLPLYGLASVFGPFIGAVFGGLCVSSVGGYENKRSAFFAAGFALVTFLSSWIVIYSDTAIFMCIGLTLFFFFASALITIISGYIVVSIPREHKGAGSLLNLLITNFLGNIPGPITYGFLKSIFKESNPRLPWKIIIYIFTLGFISSLGSAFLRYKHLSKLEDEKNKEKEE